MSKNSKKSGTVVQDTKAAAEVTIKAMGDSIHTSNALVLLLLKSLVAFVITIVFVILVSMLVTYATILLGHLVGVTEEASLPTLFCCLLFPGLLVVAVASWASIKFLSFLWTKLAKEPALRVKMSRKH